MLPGTSLLVMDGQADAVQRAFGVRLFEWHNRRSGETFFANDAPPKLPLPVMTITGLDDAFRPEPFNASNCPGFGPISPGCYGMSAQQMRTVYGVQALSDQNVKGDGQTVAIEASTGFSMQYIDDFDQRNNLIAPTILVTHVEQGGIGTGVVEKPGAPMADPGTSSGNEVDLDIESVHAMADHATVHVYEMDPGVDNVNAFLTAVAFFHEHIASVSSGECEMDLGGQAAGWAAEVKTIVDAANISLLVATGDTGRLCYSSNQQFHAAYGVNYPASDPSATAVGGTYVDYASDGSRSAETAWDEPTKQWTALPYPEASGGGPDPSYASQKPVHLALAANLASYTRPSWQEGPGVPPGTQRLIPDVSADAGHGLEIAVNPASNGNNNEFIDGGGTSQSAPLWAGIVALVDQEAQQQGKGPIGQKLNAALYLVPTLDSRAFFDVTSGENGGPDLAGPAGTGWDLATGIGSPNATSLVPDLVTAVGTLTPTSYTDLHTVDWNHVTLPAGTCGANAPFHASGSHGVTVGSDAFPPFGQVSVSVSTHPYQGSILPQVSFGDLDGIGHDDGAVTVYCEVPGGASASSVLEDEIVVYTGANGVRALGVLTPFATPVGGASGSGAELTDVRLSLHRLEATEHYFQPGDPQCCPSGNRVDVWTWSGSQFAPLGHNATAH